MLDEQTIKVLLVLLDVCLLFVVFALLVIRRTAWIKSKTFDLAIGIFVLLTVAVFAAIFWG